MLQRKKFGPKIVRTKTDMQLAEMAVQCLCDILISHPYFNYNMNVGQLLVVLLNNQNSNVRKSVFECFVSLFKTDKRYDLTRHVSIV
jgi:nucleolar complex protein 3